MATNKGRKFYVSKTSQPVDMTITEFEAVTDWLEVTNVGEVGESVISTNIVSYPTMDTEFTNKGKGISDAGDMTITC